MTRFVIFLIVETKLDIALTTFLASCFTKNLSYQYTKILKTIFCYLKSLKKQKIIYNGQTKLRIERYSDSD